MTLFVKPGDVERVVNGLNAYKNIFENEYSLTDTLVMKVEMAGEKTGVEVFPK